MPQEMGLESQAFEYISHFLGKEDSQARDFDAQLQAADRSLRAKARMPPWQSSHQLCCLQLLPANQLQAGRLTPACFPAGAGLEMGQAGCSGGEQGATAQAQSLSAKGRKEDPETAGFPVQAVIISSSSEISQDLARIMSSPWGE